MHSKPSSKNQVSFQVVFRGLTQQPQPANTALSPSYKRSTDLSENLSEVFGWRTMRFLTVTVEVLMSPPESRVGLFSPGISEDHRQQQQRVIAHIFGSRLFFFFFKTQNSSCTMKMWRCWSGTGHQDCRVWLCTECGTVLCYGEGSYRGLGVEGGGAMLEWVGAVSIWSGGRGSGLHSADRLDGTRPRLETRRQTCVNKKVGS